MTTAPAPPKPRAVGYVRVSSVAQAAEDKVSLGEQTTAIEAYCQERGLELIETFQDVMSGSSRKRPSWCRMLQGAEAGAFEHVVCWSGDRLARGGAPMGDLLDACAASKVTIHTANGTTFDRRYAELLASIARLERDAFQERAMVGRRGRAKSGRLPVARAPFGYVVGRADDGKSTGLLEIDPETGPVVRRIFELAAGPEGVGTRTIANTLNREATPSPNGDHWWPGTISRILADRAYIGNYLYGTRRGRGRTNDDEVIQVEIPALVGAGLWESAQRSASKRAAGFGRRKHIYTLSGLLKCEVCERSMAGTARVSNHGKRLEEPRRYYRCAIGKDLERQPWNCRTKSHQPAADIEEAVWYAVSELLQDPCAFCDALLEETGPDDGLDAEILDAKRILRRIDEEEQRLVSLYIRGGFTQDNLEAEKQLLDERRAAAQAHLEGLEGRRAIRVDGSALEYSVKALLDGVASDLNALDSAGRKALIQQVVEAVTLDGGGHVAIRFNFMKVDSEAELAALRVAPRLTRQVV